MITTVKVKQDFYLFTIMQRSHCVARIWKKIIHNNLLMNNLSPTVSILYILMKMFFMQNQKLGQKTALPQFIEQITMRVTIKVKYDFHLVMIMQHSHCVARISAGSACACMEWD